MVCRGRGPGFGNPHDRRSGWASFRSFAQGAARPGDRAAAWLSGCAFGQYHEGGAPTRRPHGSVVVKARSAGPLMLLPANFGGVLTPVARPDLSRTKLRRGAS